MKTKKYNPHLYEVWYSMKKRCYNPRANNYERYGGRGITVCEEWKNSFENFCEWAEMQGDITGLQLDRIDNNAGYSPQNCKFSTVKEQANNRRSTKFVTFNGMTQSLKMWAETYGISYWVLRNRYIYAGWDFETSLTAPVRPLKRRR